MATPLLTTKLYIPPVRPDPSTGLRTRLVSRPRLIERLNEGLHRKLTLISAPAGFGRRTKPLRGSDSQHEGLCSFSPMASASGFLPSRRPTPGAPGQNSTSIILLPVALIPLLCYTMTARYNRPCLTTALLPGRQAYHYPITTLTGAVADQAKNRGILSKIWDLRFPLPKSSRGKSSQR